MMAVKKTKPEKPFFDLEKHLSKEHHDLNSGGLLRDVILGGQDGLVNVLGIVLGVAAATNESRIVIIAGLAATFAESISMAAVAYTSTKAERDFYSKQYEKEKFEIERGSRDEVDEVREVYRRKGFKGRTLEEIVKGITADNDRWLDFMMAEELGLGKPDARSPVNSALIVGFAAIIGSLIPITPFFFTNVGLAMPLSLVLASVLLFAGGIIKAKFTVGSWWKTGLEMTVIGMLSAIAGYVVGAILGVAIQ